MLQRFGSLRLKPSEKEDLVQKLGTFRDKPEKKEKPQQKETILQRIGSLRLRSERRERVRVRRIESGKETGGPEPDAAYDVTDYFLDDVADPWTSDNAVERERLSQHAQLRELLSRGDSQQLRAKLSSLGKDAGIVTNLTPNGANTLLYVASEAGLTSAVTALLEAGADGRAHPVTRYCPLYIAAYHGHADIARVLLAHFPRSVQQETVEKWLPLHAACIGTHAALVTLLLEYPYPPAVLHTYTDATGQWEYSAAFDVNARDVSGQTALYIASTLGSQPVVDVLLDHSVLCARRQSDQEDAAPLPPPPPPSAALSPARAGISLGIHAIVNKLTGHSRKEPTEEPRVRPVRIDISRGVDSCLAAAVRGGHIRVVKRLLAAGASPDATASPPQEHASVSESRARRRSRSASAVSSRASVSPSPGRYADRDGPWTALALAARAQHVAVVELLLSAGATDPHCRALRECVRHGLVDLVCSLLATKAYPDPDFKLNKSTLSENVFSTRESDAALTFSAVCPTTPVMVNWRELRCQLQQIRMSWLRAASIKVNAKLSSSAGALHALTRLDVSNNELTHLPAELFTLLSLRYLNAAQNKLERLPSPSDPFEDELDSKGRKIKRKKVRPEVYSAPVLQEIYLQDNRLEELPPELFLLPAMSSLDVSNNKLRVLPGAMWRAPALRDLNAALNHLKDLPTSENDSEPVGSKQATSPSDSSPQLTPSSSSGHFNFTSQSKSWSRSPSIERSEGDALEGDSDIPVLGDRAGNTVSCAAVRAHPWCPSAEAPPPPAAGAPPLLALNLSHNQFTAVPLALACKAKALTRLNMAYNSLRSMSYVTSYPTSLRQLDLSHNEITCWPSLPQVDNLGTSEGDPLTCYCSGPTQRTRPRSGGSVRAQLMSTACPARRHLRLESLRTLILSNNLLTRIQLTTDDDGFASAPHDGSNDNEEDEEWGSGSRVKGRLLFPLLSMLDVSCNMLRGVPPAIHELSNLAVLNISGNKDITDLPPTLGLLSRLWNLSAAGCALGEPLRAMLAGGKYRSADVVGYLKSVLQEARPYARMKLMLTGVQGIGKTSLLECLRQESAIQHRRKATDHWAKRMGNKSSRRNMSTVGVDIGTWTYEKQRSTRGPVTFNTWDFGGQHEYYSTHQYFLTRRSLYLVLWKVTDGKKGLATALQWLRSIQARAPGSPVIMVATHYDQVGNSNLPESESPEALQRLIRSSMLGAPDADKLGLPRVLDSVEVSCSTRHNVRLLADVIYSVAFSVKPPGSKEPLLEQRVPATYLALEDCVTSLAADLTEPVLRHPDYKRLVTQYMQQKNLRMFRDATELHQATMFLHENGVLLHYDDATLKELYFLKPQWLCDVLAHVVTVREINPFANNGIMKVEDLAHVFKASPQLARGEEAGPLGLSLLNKFELALCWDTRLLLVPPLLPHTEPTVPQLPLRPRGWSGPPWPAPAPAPTPAPPPPPPLPPPADSARRTDSPALINESPPHVVISSRAGGPPLRRLLLLSYVPRGFWPRLVTRVLSDTALKAAAPALYAPHDEMELEDSVAKALNLPWGWRLWQSGLAVSAGELNLLSVRELRPRSDPLLGPIDSEGEYADDLYRDLRLRVKQDGSWCSLEVESSACIEILLPAPVCVLRREDNEPIAGYQSMSLEPRPEVLARVLAILSDHVDLLLEDWYPSLGTRFVHTSEGRCLITRVVPCPYCLRDLQNNDIQQQQRHNNDHHLSQAFKRLELGDHERRRMRLSEESRTSDGDSGVGNESNASSRIGSVEGIVNENWRIAFGWTVEQCILSACTNTKLHCGHHGQQELRDKAPDTLLLDVEEEKRARWEHITRGAVCGRGAFGTVLSGSWRPRGGRESVSVAIKALQPVPPPTATDMTAHHAYKAALSRWERDPQNAACRAYCGLRQELVILLQLKHPHVVPLRAACAAPLALLLDLAPMGALDGVLKQYRSCGVRVGRRAARALALQAARALEYLHARRIVYRDLKSENVLVWSMPRPQESAAAERSASPIDVHVKLGDYGISRMAPPSGTKGFGGTEGFMAPEIMRYNGEEEYNEKVDCFSYGMLLYEILTLRQPFEGHEAVKEAVLDGARPTLTPKDLQLGCVPLQVMRRCWSSLPSCRPSAAALVSVSAAPEYTALADAARAKPCCTAAVTPYVSATDEAGGWEVWSAGEAERIHTLVCDTHAFTQQHTIRVHADKSDPVTVTALCQIGDKMWAGDSAGRLSVYNISTCALAWRVIVCETVGGAASEVSALQPLPNLDRVALALSCGRLFLVCGSRPPPEASFVLTELGAAAALRCLTAAVTPAGVEVWAGGAGLFVYTVTATGVCSADTLDCAQTVTETVTHIVHAAPSSVILYVDPGVIVYQYSISSKRSEARLDCSKLVPCSESLQSIAIDDHLSEQRCRVTALCCLGSSLLVGTAWGCVIVADAASLRPLTVFRPYEADVRAILPLLPHKGAEGEPMLATLGNGYRPLLNRFAPPQASSNPQQYTGFYCLLWRAGHWLPD